MENLPLHTVSHHSLLRATVKIAREFIHSIVMIPGPTSRAWSYIVRFAPDGAQDLIAFRPKSHKLHGQSYKDLVKMLSHLLEKSEEDIVIILMDEAAAIPSFAPLEKL